jgi:hypothetical protein
VATRRTVAAQDRREQPRGYSHTDKEPVFNLIHYENRSAHARVVDDVTAPTLMPAIADILDLRRTHLHTDGGSAYRSVAKHVAKHVAAHEWVNHEAGQYTRGNVSRKLAEGYPSQLKRSGDGTHH